MKFQGFIGPSYNLENVDVDAQRCINMYPQFNELGTGKENEVGSLVKTPGLLLKIDLGESVSRGNYTASNGTLFSVCGNTLYQIDSSWNQTVIGTLNSSTGKVSMKDNGATLVVVDGDYGYTHTLGSSTLNQITDPDFLGATQVAYQDGYFIFLKPNSQNFYISGLLDTSIDALDIASAEGAPDKLKAILCDHRELWLFGDSSTEVFYNSGNSDFPFERIEGAFVEHGCAAPWTVQKMNNSVYWVGKNEDGQGIVYMAQGYQPQRISTHAIEEAISGYGDISNADAYTYQRKGHHFYVLNFENANTTWVYDANTNLWHEMAYTNNGRLERHRGCFHTYAYNTHVLSDYETGRIYALDDSTYTDNGNVITRQRTFPHASSEDKRIFYKCLQIDLKSGVGLDGSMTKQGHNPQLLLDWSDDGGYSWANEKWTSIGKIGKRLKRAIFRRLGYSRDRIFRITYTEPTDFVLISAYLDFELGVH